MAEETRNHPVLIDRFDRWKVVWSVLFYVVLVFVTFTAVEYGSHSMLWGGLVVSLSVLLGAWHGLWRLPRVRLSDRAYFAGAAVLWVSLMIADPDFLILSLAIFAPLCFYRLSWGVVVVAATAGVWLWAQWIQEGRLLWNTVIAVSLAAAAGLILVGFTATVIRQSRERQRLIDQLRRTQSELAEAQRQAGISEERQRLARDIHDTLTQGFASIAMLLEAASASLDSNSPGRRHVERALQTARDNLAESRRLVWAMRPAPLTGASLPDALERVAGQLVEDTGIDVETVVTGSPQRLDEEVDTTLLRIAQESLANIRRHARAAHVTLTLSYVNGAVILDVHDDGIGFASSQPVTGVGLEAMHERAAALGGTLNLESEPGEGTTVVAEIPTRAVGYARALGDPH